MKYWPWTKPHREATRRAIQTTSRALASTIAASALPKLRIGPIMLTYSRWVGEEVGRKLVER